MIRVRFFAMLKTRAGAEIKEYDLKGPVPIGELKERVKKDFPALAGLIDSRSLLISINEEFAPRDAVVRDGDEVAFMPPFSGG